MIAAASLFPSLASADPCQTRAVQAQAGPGAGIQRLTDVSMNAAVATMDKDLFDRTEKALGSFRLTTQMLAGKATTKEGLADWYFNIVNLNRLTFNLIKDLRISDKAQVLQRMALYLTQNVVSYWLDHAAWQADHEQSHADAAAAFGFKNISFGTYNNPQAGLTIGQLFLEQLGHPFDRPFTTWNDPNYNKLAPNDPRISVISAAGINQQERLSEMMADEAVERGGFDATETLPYLENKLILAGYVISHPNPNSNDGSDPGDYANSLVGRAIGPNDVKATMTKMATYSILTAALSGRTWEGLGAAMNYILKGDSHVETPKIKTPVGEILWPEFSTYLNARSVTVKMDAAVRLPTSVKTTLLVSAEAPVVGSDALEFSAGARVDKRPLSATLVGVGNTRGGYGARAKLVYRIGERSGWRCPLAAPIRQEHHRRRPPELHARWPADGAGFRRARKDVLKARGAIREEEPTVERLYPHFLSTLKNKKISTLVPQAQDG